MCDELYKYVWNLTLNDTLDLSRDWGDQTYGKPPMFPGLTAAVIEESPNFAFPVVKVERLFEHDNVLRDNAIVTIAGVNGDTYSKHVSCEDTFEIC